MTTDEADGGDDAGDDHALVERVHDLGAGRRLHEVAADDGSDDGYAAERERVGDRQRRDLRLGQEKGAEEHGGDDRDRVGLEEVGRHARAVPDVVPHVVGDHGGIARIVLGYARFDLAHQVGADVGALGEDAAPETRENRDQRAAEGKADQGVGDFRDGGAVLRGAVQHPEEARHTEEPQSHDQHPGDGPAAEGDGERLVQPLARGFRGAHIGAH